MSGQDPTVHQYGETEYTGNWISARVGEIRYGNAILVVVQITEDWKGEIHGPALKPGNNIKLFCPHKIETVRVEG